MIAPAPLQAHRPRPRVLLTVIALAIAMLAMRMAAPSDLFDNEQPNTVSYTIDIIVNGQWVIPRDMFGRAPHKPPLYNWLSVPVVGWAGVHEQWAFKLPSIVGMLAAMAATALACVWLLGRDERPIKEEDRPVLARLRLWEIGLIAAAMLLASHTGAKFIYLARPDTLLLLFTTLGWLCFTCTLLVERPRFGGWVNLVGWLCVWGAAMTKGPPALLLPIYAVLGAKLLVGRWGAVRNTGIAWGLPLALGLTGAWLGAAYWVDARAVVEELLGDQAFGKVTRRGPWRIVTEAYKSPGFAIMRFLPWSLIAILTLVHIPPRRWFAHRLGPAVLWVVVVVGFFLIPADRRGDYLAPAMPALAILAAYWLLVVAAKYRIGPAIVLIACFVVAAGLGVYHSRYSQAAETGYGEHVKAFADAIQPHRHEGIYFHNAGYHNLQAYLGVNRPPPTASTRWVVMPTAAAPRTATPLLSSDPVPMWPQSGHKPLGLYPIQEVGHLIEGPPESKR